MGNKTIYLDNCARNRPFDDKEQLTIRMEAEAKLQIQEVMRNTSLKLVVEYRIKYG